MRELVSTVEKEFIKHFQGNPLIITSPGRINLIGEHTDYNGGHVLPAAINKGIVMAMAANGNNHLNLRALDYNETREVTLENPAPKGDWSDYITGVVLEMKNRNIPIDGFDMAFLGNVPIGSGLSSSAALECGVAIGLDKLFHSDLSKFELSRISQLAENNFVGVQCGLMDQYASLFGKENNILCLNCKTNTHEYLNVDFEGFELILCNSGVNHSLATSDYNSRRDECKEGLSAINNKIARPVDFLCDIDVDTFRTYEVCMSATVFKRCNYVVNENLRVINACQLIKEKDIQGVGELMYESHLGLSEEFEVSCPELDYLVNCTKDVKGILGSRMMGGGFGGCTINLVKSEDIGFFNEDLAKKYSSKFGRKLTYLPVKLSDGGKIV